MTCKVHTSTRDCTEGVLVRGFMLRSQKEFEGTHHVILTVPIGGVVPREVISCFHRWVTGLFQKG